jgi:hypothetical protein
MSLPVTKLCPYLFFKQLHLAGLWNQYHWTIWLGQKRNDILTGPNERKFTDLGNTLTKLVLVILTEIMKPYRGRHKLFANLVEQTGSCIISPTVNISPGYDGTGSQVKTQLGTELNITVIATLPRHSIKKTKLLVSFAQHTFTSCATWGLPEGRKNCCYIKL